MIKKSANMSKYQYTDENKEHLHSLDGKPLMGTSSVMEILGKTLTWWAAGLALEPFGWTNSKYKEESIPQHTKDLASRLQIDLKSVGYGSYGIPNEIRLQRIKDLRPGINKLDDEAYLSLLEGAYRAHATKKDDAATAGTDLHAEVEAYIKSRLGEPTTLFKHSPQIDWFVKWAETNVKRFLWSEMNVYSEYLWTGGITDFGYEDRDGKIFIGDIKSAKDAYLSHFLQVAGYGIQLAENGGFTADGKQIYKPTKVDGFAIFPFGSKKKEPRYRYDVGELQAGFICALKLYKLNQSFNG
jgi:hypothetical protein